MQVPVSYERSIRIFKVKRVVRHYFRVTTIDTEIQRRPCIMKLHQITMQNVPNIFNKECFSC